MTPPQPIYDLVLLLDAKEEEATRAKLLSDVRAMISSRGSLAREDDWGFRQLAYPIRHATDAEYHLLQFQASTPELLEELDRTLRIADGVIRFRIIKLKPGTPDAPEMLASAAPARTAESPAQAGESAESVLAEST
jgi:small subunit ribosomal protein S6